jgi:hypothetical protein
MLLTINRPVRLSYKPCFLANEHCFSLTTNQQTVLSAMTFQPSEHGEY